MFTLEETEIAKAIDRAKQFHPKVRMIAFGQYAVTATKGEHIVRCFRDERGYKATARLVMALPVAAAWRRSRFTLL